jgi:outer membrane lipopolysaccharide assembly protein LptE/RlpB
MNIKKLLLIFFILGLTSCGYEAIYFKNQKFNVSISDIKMEGDKKINKKIISFLNLSKNNNSNRIKLKLNSSKKIEPISKDKMGDPSIYRMTIVVYFELSNGDRSLKKKKFSSNFVYNNIKKKFDLSEYQKSIELNLIEKISEEILIFLNS